MLTMDSYVTMTQVIPEGEIGSAKVTHFGVSKEDSEFSKIRAIQHPAAFVPEGQYTRLTVNGQLVMTDTQMEQLSNFCFLSEVTTRADRQIDVLVAGLGLGMILVPALRQQHVRSILVVEKSPDVIALVVPALMEHLNGIGDKLDVVQGDIFVWKPAPKRCWDVIYFDIWANQCVDNLDEISKLKRKFARRKNKDGWMAGWEESRLRYLRRSGRWR